MAKIVAPELDKSRDLAVLKSNVTFTGSFTAGVSGADIAYGDMTTDTYTTSPSHTYTNVPPYLLNITSEKGDVTSMSISGNSLVDVDVSKFKNVTNVNVADNLLSKDTISQILVDLDENEQEDGTLTTTGNISGGDYTSDISTFYSLVGKGWNVNGVLWQPSSISTSLWFDASDSSTITIETGVSQFNDKSDNVNDNNLIQGTGSKQPTLGILNGLQVMTFDETLDQVLYTNGWDGIGDAGSLSVFMVGDKTAGHSSSSFLNFQDDMYTAESYFNPFGKRSTSSGSQSFTTPTGHFLYNANLQWDVSATLPDSFFNVFIDGTQEGIDKLYDNVFPEDHGARISIMSSNNLALSSSGTFCEAIITGLIDEATRQKIEGYLAHKWGLTVNLPVSHPYKTVAP